MSKRSSGFDYENLVQNALRKVVCSTMQDVSKNGLPSDHHFYITFDTTHSGVDLPDYLREEYPDEMTIVLQHEFWDLDVDSEGFQVTLCFDDTNERIEIPFNALISFVDPSVKFGLQFTPIETHEHRPAERISEAKAEKNLKDSDTPSDGSNVINFDSFRKR